MHNLYGDNMNEFNQGPEVVSNPSIVLGCETTPLRP